MNQQTNGGQWNLLGTFTFDPNEDHRIELTDQADGVVIADAIAVAPTVAPLNTATWTPTLSVSDDFEIYAKWPAHATHADAAPYTIFHASGSTTIYANQQTNGGQWNLLGTFTLDSGQNHRVELTDQATGNVIADAVKLVAAPNVTNKATWTPTISTSDSYKVYTRWTSWHNRATNATYTVYHAGGSSTVTVNQQTNGGEWYLLGTYTLDPASNHRVELSDDANGTVVADAVYIVSTSTTQNSVTWTPTLTQSDLVDVYAKWVDGADRSDAVSYTVYHAGGSTAVNMNQKQNGTVWNWLGRFTFNPSSNHRVEVTDSTDGVVVADAVRFVSVTSSGAGLMYVHSDHLGTPQKMTDGSQTLVWDAVYEPFGKAYSITGTGSNNQRFPGQYADAESDFYYNYFRNYDSSTGRYVQTDPIGLRGGLNTYGYVGGNPNKWADPLGLFFPTHHAQATRQAARQAGCERLAEELAELTAAVDDLEKSQSPENAHWHAMSNGDAEQSATDAEAAYLNYMNRYGASNSPSDLARALHALQDSYSAGHSGSQPWHGYKNTDWEDLVFHGAQDLYSRFTSDFDDAINASANLIERYKQRNPCRCQ